jgi:hypothetical protein
MVEFALFTHSFTEPSSSWEAAYVQLHIMLLEKLHEKADIEPIEYALLGFCEHGYGLLAYMHKQEIFGHLNKFKLFTKMLSCIWVTYKTGFGFINHSFTVTRNHNKL